MARTKSEVLKYAQRWGVLQICKHDCPTSHNRFADGGYQNDLRKPVGQRLYKRRHKMPRVNSSTLTSAHSNCSVEVAMKLAGSVGVRTVCELGRTQRISAKFNRYRRARESNRGGHLRTQRYSAGYPLCTLIICWL